FGATDVVTLDDPRLAELAREVDVVIDFVWGEIGAQVMDRVVRARADRSQVLTWIEVGSMAGAVAPVPGDILRAARVQIVGSGMGSVTGREIVKELPSIVKENARGHLHIDARVRPLSEVEDAWREAESSLERFVLTP